MQDSGLLPSQEVRVTAQGHLCCREAQTLLPALPARRRQQQGPDAAERFRGRRVRTTATRLTEARNIRGAGKRQRLCSRRVQTGDNTETAGQDSSKAERRSRQERL